MRTPRSRRRPGPGHRPPASPGRTSPLTPRLLRRAAALACAAVLAVLTVQAPAPAAATAGPDDGTGGSGTTQALCGDPRPGEFSCFAVRRTDVPGALGVRPRAQGRAAAPEGYGPTDLLSAYDLPADGGAGATIAIVDAYDNPRAEADLATYREQYGLPACTSENGCFRKIDQRGGADYPLPDDGWAGEISLDLDMVSAVAPKAHILLVEADSASTADLGTAVNTAVALGARYVSNSYGAYDDSPANQAMDEAYFNHPGTAVLFSSGDSGYGVSYPASSPYVTSVGGTALRRDAATSRGWSESVWNAISTSSSGEQRWGATGSGCSAFEPKPAYQTDDGCEGRSVADVSAVADPATGVAVYNSYSDAGWNVYGGTSASAPLVAGVYALAGTPVEGSYPASYPYLTPGALNDVTQGDNASCAESALCGGFGTEPECTPRYSCAAGPGYDGPTGLGTPQGLAAFRPGPHGTVAGKVTDRATGAAVPGATVRLGDYRALTASDGTWSLVAPTGSYPLAVSAFGYADKDLGTVDLADGADLTKDAALDAVPTRTVSGTVRDGGGHGWGVYAKLTVDGVPGTVFTDPKSGHYSVKLPLDHTYTLRATGLYPGYEPATTTVRLGDTAQTADLKLPVAGKGTLPPGYAVTYHGGGLQAFDTASAPSGWTVTNHTDAGGWEFGDPLNRGNQTGGTGRFAIVDDYALGWSTVDTELTSPAYDFTGQTKPTLDFDTALPSSFRLNDPTADIDVSTDDGASWTTIWHTSDVVNGPAHESLPLTDYAGEPSVRVRFHYAGSLTGFWQLDNVALGTRTLDTRPGGLLVGRVTDANTGAGVLGATVSSDAAPGDTGRSVASPDDPATEDGVYWVFASHTGRQRFSADLAAFGYPAATRDVRVTKDAISTADFSLRPAELTATPTAVGVSVPWGGKKTVTVRVKNTGGAAATVDIGEQALGAAPSGTGPAGAARRRERTDLDPRKVTRTAAETVAPPSGAPTDQAWQPVADLPEATVGGVAAAYDGVLYAGLGQAPGGQWTSAFHAYDPAQGTWKELAPAVTKRYGPAYGFIRGKLYVTGGKDASGTPVAGGEVYDPATDSWSEIAAAPHAYADSAAAVLGDKLYVIGGCDFSSCGTDDVQVYDPATDTWSRGPAYPDPTSWQTCATTDGVLYCAGGVYQGAGEVPRATATGYALDPATREWSPIADPPVDVWGAAGTAAGGRLLVAGGNLVGAQAMTNEAYAYDPAADAWSALPNLPNPVFGAASAPGWYVLGGQDPDRVVQSTVEVLAGHDGAHGDVPWLSATTAAKTVAARKTVTVSATLDATAMGPADAGDHRARLLIDSDGPYGSLQVPVTMTVVPPPGWVHLTGTVTGKDADGSAKPLAGATVRVTAPGGTHTLATAVDGGYALWLPAGRHSLALTVGAEGYRTVTRTVKPGRGDTLTADFALRRP